MELDIRTLHTSVLNESWRKSCIIMHLCLYLPLGHYLSSHTPSQYLENSWEASEMQSLTAFGTHMRTVNTSHQLTPFFISYKLKQCNQVLSFYSKTCFKSYIFYQCNTSINDNESPDFFHITLTLYIRLQNPPNQY